MSVLRRAFSLLRVLCAALPAVLLIPSVASTASSPDAVRVPILLYHRFGATVADSMTVTTPVFAAQMKYLRDNGYTVIPLRRLVDYCNGRAPAPKARSVVLTADDAHVSVFTEMLPVVREYRYPVTIFAYPSAISNASYAMTWDQLRQLKKSGLFDVQSHTYWHPNFRKERKRLTGRDFDRFTVEQFRRSRERLERELGGPVDMLAWPFGIYDDQLISRARETGYTAAFTIERHHASPRDLPMKLPRYLLVNADGVERLARILEGRDSGGRTVY